MKELYNVVAQLVRAASVAVAWAVCVLCLPGCSLLVGTLLETDDSLYTVEKEDGSVERNVPYCQISDNFYSDEHRGTLSLQVCSEKPGGPPFLEILRGPLGQGYSRCGRPVTISAPSVLERPITLFTRGESYKRTGRRRFYFGSAGPYTVPLEQIESAHYIWCGACAVPLRVFLPDENDESLLNDVHVEVESDGLRTSGIIPASDLRRAMRFRRQSDSTAVPQLEEPKVNLPELREL